MTTFLLSIFFGVIVLILIANLAKIFKKDWNEGVNLLAGFTTGVLIVGLIILYKYSLTNLSEIIEYVFYK